MMKLDISHRIRATSLLEVVVAMTILSIWAGIVFNQMNKYNNDRNQWVQLMALTALGNCKAYLEAQKTEGIKVETTATPTKSAHLTHYSISITDETNHEILRIHLQALEANKQGAEGLFPPGIDPCYINLHNCDADGYPVISSYFWKP